MPDQVYRGFVLRRVRYGEQALLLNIFTKEEGLITVSSRLSKKGQLNALSRLYILGDFEIHKRSNRLYLRGGQIDYVFPGINLSLEAQIAASEIARIITEQIPERLDEAAIYEILAYTFYALSEGSNVEEVFAISCLRILSELGFAPWLEACLSCGTKEAPDFYFSFARRGLVCDRRDCQGSLPSGREISLKKYELEVLRQIIGAPLNQIFNLRLGKREIKIISKFTELYLQNVLEKDYGISDKLTNLERFTLRSRERLDPETREEK